MSKNVVTLFVLFLTASYMLTLLPVRAEPRTIVVPDDYPTIQACISNATQGDKILVKSGTYYETLVIAKSISVVGEGQEKTFINAKNATDNIIYINASDVSIEGLTITNNKGFPTSVTEPDGIRVEYFSSGVSIKNNTISYIQHGNGISLLHGSGNTIEANHIMTCGGTGIFVEGGGDDTIRNNAVVDNGFDTLITGGSHNNTIVGNLFANSTNFGLQLDNDCSNNTIEGNTFATNRYGLALEPPSSNTFYHNNFLDNTYQVLLFGRNEDWAGLVNSWDNGKEGNYWSDYHGSEIDDSGIGNSPYAITANWDSKVVYLDSYPLISPFSTPPVVITEFPDWTIMTLFIIATLLTIMVRFKKRKR